MLPCYRVDRTRYYSAMRVVFAFSIAPTPEAKTAGVTTSVTTDRTEGAPISDSNCYMAVFLKEVGIFYFSCD